MNPPNLRDFPKNTFHQHLALYRNAKIKPFMRSPVTYRKLTTGAFIQSKAIFGDSEVQSRIASKLYQLDLISDQQLRRNAPAKIKERTLSPTTNL